LCGFCIPYLSSSEVINLFKDSYKLLGEGGLFYVSVIMGDNADSGYQSSSSGDRVYIHYYDLEFVCDLLAQGGFEVSQSDIVEFDTGQKEAFIYARRK
jgi:hypothetical protein